MKSLSRVQLLATPWTTAYQALPSMGFSRQEYWSGVPLPSLVAQFSSIHFSHSVASDSLRPHESQHARPPWDCSTPGFPVHHQLQSLLKLISIESVMPSNHLILCPPLLLLPSIVPGIRVLSNEWVLHIRWPKYWSFSFNISLSNEYSRLISFRSDSFDLLAVQGTLKSLL